MGNSKVVLRNIDVAGSLRFDNVHNFREQAKYCHERSTLAGMRSTNDLAKIVVLEGDSDNALPREKRTCDVV